MTIDHVKAVRRGIWDEQTQTLLFVVLAWSLLGGFLSRVRIYRDVPLPPANPVIWMLGGLLQDLALLALLMMLLVIPALFRGTQKLIRFSFGSLAFLVMVLQIIRSEAVIFFGDVIRPEDLRGDIPTSLAIESLKGTPALLLAIATITFVVFIVLRERFPRHLTKHVTPLRATIVAVVAGGAAALVAAALPGVGLARNPIIALIAIRREWLIAPSTRFHEPKPDQPLTDIHEFLPVVPDRQYVNSDYPLAYEPGARELGHALKGVKPNIIIFLMESVRAEEVGCYGGDPPGVTPNLDALAAQGIRFDPAFSAGTYTSSAEIALWYGIAPLPREILMTTRPTVKLTGLPELLRSAGWKSFLWIHGGDSNFYRRDAFYVPRGFQMIDGRSFPDTDPQTTWGYSDRAMVRHAVEILDRATEPFASMLLTVTNHHPFFLPADDGPPLPLPPGLPTRVSSHVQTVHYTDLALGDFIRLARTRPWFAHTIMVIAGDHGLTTPPVAHPPRSQNEIFELRQRVPLIIYSPMIPGGKQITGPVSQIDVLPTLLALCGLKGPWPGLGANLLDLPPDRILPMWSVHSRTLTLVTRKRTYHAVFGSIQNPRLFTGESMTDPVKDPSGLRNLAANEPQALLRFHRLATVYMNTYPWLVVNGRSGLPPSNAARRP